MKTKSFEKKVTSFIDDVQSKFHNKFEVFMNQLQIVKQNGSTEKVAFMEGELQKVLSLQLEAKKLKKDLKNKKKEVKTAFKRLKKANNIDFSHKPIPKEEKAEKVSDLPK